MNHKINHSNLYHGFNRLKDILIDNGWLETEVVKIGQTRKVLLRLSKQAKQALGLDHQNNNRESLAHEYWKNWYAQKLKDEGYKVQMEVSRVNGRVDVLAVKEGVSGVNYNFSSATIISSLGLLYFSHVLMFPGSAPHGAYAST